MSLTYTSRFDWALGSTLQFCRAGDTIDGVIVAAETSSGHGKPDNDPTTNWKDLGTISNFEPQAAQTVVSRMTPNMQVRTRVLLSTNMTYNLSLQEMSLIVQEILMGASKPDLTAGTYTPGGMASLVTGWFRFTQSAQDGTVVNTADVWATAEIKPYQFSGGKLDDFALVLTQLKSSLNTGVFSGF